MFVVHITPQPSEVVQSMGVSEVTYAQRMLEALKVPSRDLIAINAIDLPLPRLDGIDAIVVGGSRCSVYDGRPWQERLEEWIREAVARDIPFLGICYGHQSLVRAFGGVVEKDPNGREFGLTTIDLTKEGLMHSLFKGLPTAFTLYANHADCVTQLPLDFTLLATNKYHPIQFIARGTKVFGIQPHPEYTAELALAVLNSRKEIFFQEGFIHSKEGLSLLVESIKQANEVVTATGRRILQNFLEGPVTDHMKSKSIS